MKKILHLFLCMGSVAKLAGQHVPVFPASLQLVPEKTQFTRTASHSEVMQFLDTLSRLSPLLHREIMGKSPAGKDIPLVALANPRIYGPEAARKSGKPVIYVQANIHGGEVEGKEACLMLLRDILHGDGMDLLNHQILLFAPIYNVDGNDQFGKVQRQSQENSPLETGVRENGQGLDLNRDGIKLEAPETQALLSRVLQEWDAQVVIDLHTTNGTWHGYSLTWAPGYLTSGEPGPHFFVRDSILPAVTATLKQKFGLQLGPFGDFYAREGWPPRNFYTYNHHPRYLINGIGLRNRMSILSEAFAHERFYDRIHSTYHFVREILAFTNAHAGEILRINQQADQDASHQAARLAGKGRKGVRFRMVPSPKPLYAFRTYDYARFRQADGSETMQRIGKMVVHDSVTYHADFRDTLSATLPWAYIIPARLDTVVELLRKHGIRVEKLDKAETFVGEFFEVEAFRRAGRKFEGHFMASAEGRFLPGEWTAAKGDFRVDMTQPLANLLFYLLEPQSDDGLLAWNFFDSWLEEMGIASGPVRYPVFKAFSKVK